MLLEIFPPGHGQIFNTSEFTLTVEWSSTSWPIWELWGPDGNVLEQI